MPHFKKWTRKEAYKNLKNLGSLPALTQNILSNSELFSQHMLERAEEADGGLDNRFETNK